MPNYYLGIDASKGYADFVILDSDKKIVVPNFQLDDTFDGHYALRKTLCEFVEAHPNCLIHAAVESTGGYENNWYERFKSLSQVLPVKIARLNPSLVKANIEAGLKRNKTDQLSARDVAEYLICHPEKARYNENAYPILRRSWTFIRMITKQKTQLINQLDSLLYATMPEMLSFAREGYPNWLLQVLNCYPTYDALLAAGTQELTKLPYVSLKKAERLIKLVYKGIGNSDPLSGKLIKAMSAQILQLDQQIKEQKKLLEQNCQEAKQQVELLNSFKGIGIYSAIGLLLNIIDVSRFPTAKNLASYFGLHPEYRKSGDDVWRMCMSKKGRAEPRAILFMVTMSAICHNPLIKELYHKQTGSGMNKMAAIGVCMHKILRIVYGILKNKTPFDPKIDKTNQAKYENQTPKIKKNKTRRLQDFDENAPISRRQKQKRQELQKSIAQNPSGSEAAKSESHSEQLPDNCVELGTLLESYPHPDKKNPEQ